MHILITGAAGMIGRKLVARLVAAGALNGKPIDKLTLIDVSAPQKPQGFAGSVATSAADIADAAAARAAVAGRPDVIFHLAAVVSGEAELDFEKGVHVNLDGSRALIEAIRAAGDGYCPRLVFTSSIAVFGAPFPECDRRRLSPDAAHLLRHPEGHRRAAARRLHPPRFFGCHRHPAAEHRGAAGPAEQGGVRFLLVDHPRAA